MSRLRPIAASEKIRNGIITALIRKSFWVSGMAERGGENDREPDAVLQYREDRLVAGVVGLELAGLAVKHLSVLTPAR